MHAHHTLLSDRNGDYRAFTLLELLIAITILGIAAFLVIPATDNDQYLRLRAAARLLLADIEQAQVGSIGNGADPLVVVFDTSNSGYYLAHRSDPATPAMNHASGTQFMTVFGQGRAAALAGIEIYSVSVGGDNVLGFSALGTLDQSADAVISLRCGSSSIDITVNALTGEPTVD